MAAFDGDLDLDADPISSEPSMTFRLGGYIFRCRQKEDLHWGTIEGWMTARATGDAADIAVGIDEFMATVLWPEDIDEFTRIKNDVKGPLTVSRQTKLMQEVNHKVLGMKAADPTQPSSASPAGSRTTGSTSKAKSSAKRGARSAA